MQLQHSAHEQITDPDILALDDAGMKNVTHSTDNCLTNVTSSEQAAGHNQRPRLTSTAERLNLIRLEAAQSGGNPLIQEEILRLEMQLHSSSATAAGSEPGPLS